MIRPNSGKRHDFRPSQRLLPVLVLMGLIMASFPAGARSDSLKPRPPLGDQARFSGEWQRIGRTNQGQYLVLDQLGDKVSGSYRYPEGWARVKGRVLGDRLRLDIIHDDPELLTRWLPLQVAREVKGVSSALDLVWSPAAKELKGPLSPFHVRFDPQTYAVSLIAQGGTRAAAQAKPPEHAVFKRVATGTAGPRPKDPARAGDGSLRVEAEEVLDSGLVRPKESKEVPLADGSGGRAFRLARGGDWLLYTFSPPQGGTFHFWLREFKDRREPVRGPALEVYLNGRRLNPAPADDASGAKGWGWRRVAQVRLTRSKQVLLIIKAATTPSPTLLDAWGLTKDPGSPPRD